MTIKKGYNTREAKALCLITVDEEARILRKNLRMQSTTKTFASLTV